MRKATVSTTPRKTPNRTTVADDVYAKLREQLITGTRQPGEKLTLRALAEEFKTSVQPIREAVRRLNAQGGLFIHPNRTISVSAPNHDQFEELLQIRAVLEGLACENAVRHMRDSDIQRIRQLGQRFEREAVHMRPNPLVLARLNRELHFAIYRISRMPQLIKLIENIWIQTSPTLTLAIRHTAQAMTMRDALKARKRLIEAIAQKNPSKARQAMVATINESAELIQRSGILWQFDAIVPSPQNSTETISRQHRI